MSMQILTHKQIQQDMQVNDGLNNGLMQAR